MDFHNLRLLVGNMARETQTAAGDRQDLVRSSSGLLDAHSLKRLLLVPFILRDNSAVGSRDPVTPRQDACVGELAAASLFS